MKSRIALASVVSVVAVSLLVLSLTLTPGNVAVASPQGDLKPISVEQVAHEADRNTLRVNNQTPFITILYIGGVRVGWMRPYHTGMINGLLAGYYRLYAHSQYGTMSWGPRDAWVPGSWNLLY